MTKFAGMMALSLAAAFVSGMTLVGILGSPDAPRQPIEFDHSLHASNEDGPQLDCAFCHEHADKSSHATVPSSATCMGCHESVKPDSPEIQKLAAYYERQEQPPWVRVCWVEQSADVYFTHKPHTAAGVDCSQCHGPVEQMRRVRREVNQSMGWCVDCHRQRNVSTDCYVCHR
ncbi:MAG TPA: cytochrome c3 family protein [Blastocatellia bacterium]|nr:cytochrome c3 family protein [Blastocatellia bacterium]